MSFKNSNLIIIPVEELQELLNPIISKLEMIEDIVGKEIPPKKSYYRNKDLKKIFGLSDNTILKYRETGIIPYTYLDNIYYYPIQDLDKILKENSNYELFLKRAS